MFIHRHKNFLSLSFLLPTTTFATFVNGLGPGPGEFLGRLS